MTHAKMRLSLFTPIKVLSSLGSKNKVYMSSSPHIQIKNPMLSQHWKKRLFGFTSRQIERYKLYRKVYSNVGLPNVKNCKHMVSTNIISNFPISVANIGYVKSIYKPFILRLKRNPSRIKPRKVINYYIHIPTKIHKNNSDIEFCIEFVYINGFVFLL